MPHGNVEDFPRGTLEDGYTSHNPQYFAIGKPVVKLKDRIAIMKAVTGTDGRIPDSIKK